MKKHIKPSKWAMVRILANVVVICALAITFILNHGDSQLWPLALAGIAFEFFAVPACEFLRSRYAFPLFGVCSLVWAGILFYIVKVIRFHIWSLAIAIGLLALGVAILAVSITLIFSGYLDVLDALDLEEVKK